MADRCSGDWCGGEGRRVLLGAAGLMNRIAIQRARTDAVFDGMPGERVVTFAPDVANAGKGRWSAATSWPEPDERLRTLVKVRRKIAPCAPSSSAISFFQVHKLSAMSTYHTNCRFITRGMSFSTGWSGRWGSNPRHPAWEAGVLPLNYARAPAGFLEKMALTRKGRRQLICTRWEHIA